MNGCKIFFKLFELSFSVLHCIFYLNLHTFFIIFCLLLLSYEFPKELNVPVCTFIYYIYKYIQKYRNVFIPEALTSGFACTLVYLSVRTTFQNLHVFLHTTSLVDAVQPLLLYLFTHFLFYIFQLWLSCITLLLVCLCKQPHELVCVCISVFVYMV